MEGNNTKSIEKPLHLFPKSHKKQV